MSIPLLAAESAFRAARADFFAATGSGSDNELVRRLWPTPAPEFTEDDAARARAAALDVARRVGLRDAPDELLPHIRASRAYGAIWDAAYEAACGSRGGTITVCHDHEED